MNNVRELGCGDEILQRLSHVSLFDGMSDEELIRWAAKLRVEHRRRGTVVIRQGDQPESFYIVDQGELRARLQTDDEDVLRAYFYPGDFLGETGLLTGELRNATIDVLTDAELLVLDRRDFDQLMAEYPDIRDQLLALAREREQMGQKRFPWLQPDEVTIFFSTKHVAALLSMQRSAILMGLLGLAAAAVYLWLASSPLLSVILMVAAGALLAFAVFMLFYNILDWRNDHYIITNRRALHVERVLMVREERDEAPLERVQDVQVYQEGVLAKVLDFGDVVIQTAAATQKIVFSSVPDPESVREALFAPMRYARTREKAEVREAIRQELGHRLNIPVSSLDGKPRAGTATDSGSPLEEGELEGTQRALAVLGGLGEGWRRLRSRFTFETRIVTDGGNTITWRKNGWILVRMSLLPLFMGLLVLLFLLFSLSRGIGVPAVPLLMMSLLIFVFGWWFYVYWDWQNDIYQVSGNRLIDLKKRPLFMEEHRRETTLDRIENISLSIPSMMAQLFNYGTVIIETAGETGAFEFEYVHDPRSVQAEVFSLRERYVHWRQREEIQSRRSEFAEWFEIYEELRSRDEIEDSEGAIENGVETDPVIR